MCLKQAIRIVPKSPEYPGMKLSASKGYRGGPYCTPALSLLLGSFLDLDYLVRYEPVSLPVDRLRRFFVWGFG